uniref:Uncharacterized protein n=1 Tax=Anguilla anguilla TaxID=7936 RepID=A0A0E9WNX7_ANGAN
MITNKLIMVAPHLLNNKILYKCIAPGQMSLNLDSIRFQCASLMPLIIVSEHARNNCRKLA